MNPDIMFTCLYCAGSFLFVILNSFPVDIPCASLHAMHLSLFLYLFVSFVSFCIFLSFSGVQ